MTVAKALTATRPTVVFIRAFCTCMPFPGLTWSIWCHLLIVIPAINVHSICTICYSFSALSLLVGWHEEDLACKKSDLATGNPQMFFWKTYDQHDLE